MHIYTWEAKSPQPVTTRATPGSAEVTKLCNIDPHMEIHWVAIMIFDCNVPESFCMIQNAGRTMWHQIDNQIFPTKCLRRILKIFWPNVTSNDIMISNILLISVEFFPSNHWHRKSLYQLLNKHCGKSDSFHIWHFVYLNRFVVI